MDNKTLQRALKMLERRDYSRGELTEKLMEKGEPAAESEAAAQRLEELGLINDGRYAAIVVRHYAAKGYGLSRIKNELYRRHIDRDLWDEALEELPDQSGRLDSLLRQKLRGQLSDPTQLKKATDALARRGFSWNEIKAAVARLETDE